MKHPPLTGVPSVVQHFTYNAFGEVYAGSHAGENYDFGGGLGYWHEKGPDLH